AGYRAVVLEDGAHRHEPRGGGDGPEALRAVRPLRPLWTRARDQGSGHARGPDGPPSDGGAPARPLRRRAAFRGILAWAHERTLDTGPAPAAAPRRGRRRLRAGALRVRGAHTGAAAELRGGAGGRARAAGGRRPPGGGDDGE